MSAVVIAFPNSDESTREDCGPRSCDRCVHFMSGYLGQFCRSYLEDIFSLHEAQSCDLYEEV